MPVLFNVDIAGLINKHMGKLLLPLTLIKITPGTRTDGSLTKGTNPTSASYSGRGIISDYREFEMRSGIVQLNDKKIMILGASLPAGIFPTTADKVTIEGKTYVIQQIPALPFWQ